MSVAKMSSRKKIALFVLVFVAGVAFAGVFSATLEYTNTMEFCVSCHTMDIPYTEYQTSRHYQNKSGVQATCADCHVPKDFWPKMKVKLIAAKDIYHEILGTIDTPEKFEARRWYMASIVWDRLERSNSRECRSCHEFKNMDLSEQSRSARARHARAEERGQTCIECHKAVVHAMPQEPEQAPELASHALN